MLGGFLTVIICTIVVTANSGFAAASANSPIFGVAAMAVSVIIVPLVSMFTPRHNLSSVYEKSAETEEV
jgi:hypothetical protein